MHIILGASGHVGSALAEELLRRGEPVTVVTRDAAKSPRWQQQGAQVAVADVHDTEALRRVFAQGQRLFLLNPPADPSTDTALEERKSLTSILAALDGSGLEKVVAQSTYGAQPGERIGDLGVLYEMEQALAAQPIPFTVIRGAYYMSNWDMALETAQQEGKVHSFYPPDFKLPMVAPQDIGQLAAQLMTEAVGSSGSYSIEGPRRYTTSDVAQAFATALVKPVEAVVTPRNQWHEAIKGMGFSDKATESFVAMTALTLDGQFPEERDVIRGSTTLEQYVEQLVRSQRSSA